jgi:hypothetical protein
MSLDVLAPDQRAVVQLVLQQDRSYEELAGLLGIAPEAVRDRARRGLERLAPGDGLTDDERGELADYLLGQQSVSGRETTRALLAASSPARDWARAVAGELEPIARGGLPEIPEAEPAPDAAPEPTVVEPLAEAEALEAEPKSADDEAPPAADEPAAAERPTGPAEDVPSRAAEDPEAGEAEPAPAVRARPRPRPGREPASGDAAPTVTPPARPGRPGDRGTPPRSSRLGGGLLIGGLAILLVALVVWLVTKGGDDDNGTARNTDATATPTATATSDFRPQGSIPLTSPTGGPAKGTMVIFTSQSQGVAFTIQATNVPANRDGEAYAVWLTGGDKPHRLGFAPVVGSDGRFGTSGPQADDADRFVRWFTNAKNVVVSRETSESARQPGPVVMRGRIPSGAQGSG